MEPRSYRESDNEVANINAHYAARAAERKAKMTVHELVMEGLVNEEYRLIGELERLRKQVARIPDTESILEHHREKMTRYKNAHDL